jgi:hypothetical protein
MDSCILKVHQGLLWNHYGYQDHKDKEIVPIIDNVYVLLDFVAMTGIAMTTNSVEAEALPKQCAVQHSTIMYPELCMLAEGSRHQEEIIVTGMKSHLEAYLPENEVFLYQRPMLDGLWKDKNKPPPLESFSKEIFDCYNLRQVYDFANSIPKMHSGYHYCLTVINWKHLINAIKDSREGRPFTPKVTLDDGTMAVAMGIASMVNISNGDKVAPVMAHHGTPSDILVNHVPNTNGAHDETTVFMSS